MSRVPDATEPAVRQSPEPTAVLIPPASNAASEKNAALGTQLPMPPELCPDVEMYPKESPQQAPKHWLLRLVNIIVPRGGALSGMLNLASVTLGAGIISIPSAFNTSGMVMAMVYLLAVTALTVFSIHLLVAASERTGYRSFESLARGLLGRGADIAVAL
ncbi:amino acid transporter, partial [Trypanosoma rangeli]